MTAMAGQPTSPNLLGFFGHVALRTIRMQRGVGAGRDRDEWRAMCRLLDEALRHGAIGLSVNHSTKTARGVLSGYSR